MKGQGRAERTLASMIFFFLPLVMTHKSAEDTCPSSVERVRVVGFHLNEVSRKRALAISSLSP